MDQSQTSLNGNPLGGIVEVRYQDIAEFRSWAEGRGKGLFTPAGGVRLKSIATQYVRDSNDPREAMNLIEFICKQYYEYCHNEVHETEKHMSICERPGMDYELNKLKWIQEFTIERMDSAQKLFNVMRDVRKERKPAKM